MGCLNQDFLNQDFEDFEDFQDYGLNQDFEDFEDFQDYGLNRGFYLAVSCRLSAVRKKVGFQRKLRLYMNSPLARRVGARVTGCENIRNAKPT